MRHAVEYAERVLLFNKRLGKRSIARSEKGIAMGVDGGIC